MGIEYLTPEEILDSQTDIKTELHDKPTYFVRTGTALKICSTYIEKDARILEVGTGSGLFAKALLEGGYKYIVGTDIDDYRKNDVKDKIEFEKRDLCFEKLSAADESFDAVLAIAIIEHLENPLLPLREFARVLKPGGHLVVAIPHIFSIKSRVKFLLHGDVDGFTETNNHISLHTKALFKKLYLKDFDLVEEVFSEGHIKVLGKKIRFPKQFNRMFGNKVLIVLKRK